MQSLPAPTAVVADDERLMREQIIARLKEAWPELVIVGEAGNGREAIALVQSLEPDIVFLDISMPGVDGIEAARTLAGLAHVVFVTAHDQYAIGAFEQGAVDYLLNPAEPERVALTCQRLRARQPGPPIERVPGRHPQVEARFAEGRDVGHQGRALFGEDADHADLAGAVVRHHAVH